MTPLSSQIRQFELGKGNHEYLNCSPKPGVGARTNPCSPRIPKSICSFICRRPNGTLRGRDSATRLKRFPVSRSVCKSEERPREAFEGNSWTRITPQVRALKANRGPREQFSICISAVLAATRPPKIRRGRRGKGEKRSAGTQREETFTSCEKGMRVQPGGWIVSRRTAPRFESPFLPSGVTRSHYTSIYFAL